MLITSNQIAKYCDVVYSQNITHKEFKNVDKSTISVILQNEDYIFYKMKEFVLKENDLIFCNTYMIEELFKNLNGVQAFKNIKIVTNQNDQAISKKLFESKPGCISEWYSINVKHIDEKIIPIPLGLANDYSPKNLNTRDFINSNPSNIFEKKKIHLYLNFRSNTNDHERRKLYDKFSKYNWAKIVQPNQKKSEYLQDLKNTTFVLCPWGNGLDTHRIWEALYSGAIPIIKYHHTFNSLKNLPILFVNDYDEITYDLLSEYIKNLKKADFELSRLYLDYWINLFKKNNIEDNNKSIRIKTKESHYLIFIIKFFLMRKINSYYKKLTYYSKKIVKLFFIN